MTTTNSAKNRKKTEFMGAVSGTLIGMSGGVDSSVAACLVLESGCADRVAGTTLKLFDGEDGKCCSVDDVTDARSVCSKLGIRYFVLNLKREFQSSVIDNFAETYIAGDTPNPCIECNRHLKFGRMLSKARELGFANIATGHYARITRIGGEYYLQKGLDGKKDQSYVLYMIARDDLQRVKLPLGELTKSEVRGIAREKGLLTANKRDSQDICFVPDGDYAAFIGNWARDRKIALPGAGCFVGTQGQDFGKNKGALAYTIGQRRGLGVSYSEPLYVTAKRGSDVILGTERELYSSVLSAKDVNVLVPDVLSASYRLSAKTRYSQIEQPCTAEFTESGVLRVEFDEPQRAITPGQSVVLYDGGTVICGGVITDNRY
jgi:tRNA-specific 2-thiouridylase